MPFSAGDGVLARRTLGMLNLIEAGSFGVVRDAHWGGYTVDFAGRIVHSVTDHDLEPARAIGPWLPSDQAWWLAPSEPQRATTAAAPKTPPIGKDSFSPGSMRDLALRVVLAVPLVVLLVYVFTYPA